MFDDFDSSKPFVSRNRVDALKRGERAGEIIHYILMLIFAELYKNSDDSFLWSMSQEEIER